MLRRAVVGGVKIRVCVLLACSGLCVFRHTVQVRRVVNSAALTMWFPCLSVGHFGRILF